MTDVRTQVKLFVESEGAPEGLSYMDCPTCGQKRKLLIGRFDDGGYFYKCLRASCGEEGGFGSVYHGAGNVIRFEAKPVPKVPQRNTYPRAVVTENNNTRQEKWFKNEYGLSASGVQHLSLGTLYFAGECERRFVFPIYRPTGEITGYVARSYNTKSLHKALIRPYNTTSPLISWYGNPTDYAPKDELIIVEDQVSAARIGQHRPCVALLGTALSESAIKEIAKHWSGTIRIALDNDATDKAGRMAKWLPGSYLYPLFKDVKDMDEREFKEFIGV